MTYWDLEEENLAVLCIINLKAMKTGLLSLFLVAALQITAVNWYPKQNYGGTGRNRAFGFSIPSIAKGYLIGGYDWSYRKDTWQYDTLTNAWTQMVNFPAGSTVGAAFSIGNKGYAGLGTDAGFVMYNTFYEFDPALNTWAPKANFPGGPRSYIYNFAAGGKGYVGGGMDPSQAVYDDLYEYDPVTDSWTAKANFPGGTRFLTAHMNIGSKGYVGMGMDASYTVVYNDFYEYDPAANSWIARAPLPAGNRGEPSCFSLCDKGFLTCGYSVPHTVFHNDFWSFDPSLNTWTSLAAFPGPARAYAPAFAIGKTGYVGTGYNGISMFTDFYSVPFHLPQANFTTTDSTLCPGQTMTLLDQSTGGTINSWNWNISGGTPGSSTTMNQLVSYAAPGNYDVTLIVKNECSADTLFKPLYISVFPAPALLVSNDTAVCAGGSVALSAAGANLYSWSPALWLNTAVGPNVIASPSATLTYTVTVTDVNGCTTLDSIKVSIAPYPVASFSPDQFTGGEPLTVTFANTSSGAVNYFWDFGDGNTSTLFNPANTYSNYGEYPVMLVAINQYGCADTAWYNSINVGGIGFYIPNAFTPDGNGDNELFGVEGYGIKKFQGYIFDRWGHLVYQWDNSNGGWDGTLKGEKVPEGIYVYTFTLTMDDNRVYSPKGHVTVVR
jgi:gliding motility-associated-like protein